MLEKMFTTENQQYIRILDWILSQSTITFETQNIKDANPQTLSMMYSLTVFRAIFSMSYFLFWKKLIIPVIYIALFPV